MWLFFAGIIPLCLYTGEYDNHFRVTLLAQPLRRLPNQQCRPPCICSAKNQRALFDRWYKAICFFRECKTNVFLKLFLKRMYWKHVFFCRECKKNTMTTCRFLTYQHGEVRTTARWHELYNQLLKPGHGPGRPWVFEYKDSMITWKNFGGFVAGINLNYGHDWS